MSQANIDCSFAVAASVGVTYDWGEHDKIKELSTSYNYFQHLHSDKRYVYVNDRSSHPAKNGFIGWINLGE
jgi:hypothetical protein